MKGKIDLKSLLNQAIKEVEEEAKEAKFKQEEKRKSTKEVVKQNYSTEKRKKSSNKDPPSISVSKKASVLKNNQIEKKEDKQRKKNKKCVEAPCKILEEGGRKTTDTKRKNYLKAMKEVEKEAQAVDAKFKDNATINSGKSKSIKHQ